MKKLVVTVLTLLTGGAAYALPVGNPYEASLYLNGAWWDNYYCDPCYLCFSWNESWSFKSRILRRLRFQSTPSRSKQHTFGRNGGVRKTRLSQTRHILH